MSADQTQTEPFRLLFVCTGNTCRSPLAEVIARAELQTRGWTHARVRSRGAGAFDGHPASEGALGAARRHGLDLSAHRSARVSREDVAWADLILTMSPAHLHVLVELDGGDKSALITSFAAGQDPTGVPGSVTDPFGGSDEVYEATFELLERLVGRVLDRLAPVVAP